MIDDTRKLVGRVSESFKKRLYGRTFRCPVCHLELAFADADGHGLMVCPLCGVVIDVDETYGHPVPVVLDVEIHRPQPKSRVHPMASHLPIGLFPVAFLGAGILFLISVVRLFNSRLGASLIDVMPLVADATLFVLALSVMLSTLTFVSGLWDWRHRYRGRPYRQIRLKIGFSIAFLAIGTVAVLLHGAGLVFTDGTGLVDLTSPGGLSAGLVYLGLLIANMAVLATLGHVGGTLVFGK